MRHLYDSIGGSYEQAKRRLMTDQLLETFVLRFPADPTLKELSAAINAEDASKAFAAAHTLKGLALTLAFEQLGQAASDLTEALRNQHAVDWPQCHGYFHAVEDAYAAIMAAIECHQHL